MDWILDLISVLFEVYLIYMGTRILITLYNFSQDYQDNESRSKKIRDHLAGIIHQVKSETHNGIQYWFDAHDDTFLAQGRDDAELVAALKARWIDHIFILKEKYVMAGPDFAVTEIKDPEEVGRMLAERILKQQGN